MSAPIFEFREMVAEPPASGFYTSFGKRLLDVVLVVIFAPIVVPLLGLILTMTALSGGAPLYSQPRVGRDGRHFRCWKIRTMVRGADTALEDILRNDPQLADEWSRTQKLGNDPRVTRLGAVLRRLSLDELPQLWNVFCGEMSLVGPRPFLPDQAALYLGGRRDADYYRVRPGITGSWQISRRNLGSFAERAVFDTDYCGAISFWADMSILLRTVTVVIRATGL
ncbi:MAG: sugar transferase [Rhodobacteraceae bacterium]|nr:sugar transferase [Paracoccaceae bacterium]